MNWLCRFFGHNWAKELATRNICGSCDIGRHHCMGFRIGCQCEVCWPDSKVSGWLRCTRCGARL